MQNARRQFFKRIVDEWISDLRPKAASRFRKALESIVTTGITVAIAFAWTPKMDETYQLAVRGAVAIASGFAVFTILHIIWSLATAPQRVFNSQEAEIKSLDTQLQLIHSERDELQAALHSTSNAASKNLREMTATDVGRVHERLFRLYDENPDSLPEWAARVDRTVAECIFHPHSKSLRNLLSGLPDDPALKERCRDKLHYLIKHLSLQQINPEYDFRRIDSQA